MANQYYEGPQVRPEVRPSARLSGSAPEGAFGGMGDVPRQADALAAQAGAIAQEEKDKADFTNVLKATSELSSWVTATQYDQQNGIVTKQGENAFALPHQVMTDYQKKASELADGLTGDRQRQAFQQKVAEHGQGLDRFVQAHVASERTKYNAQVADTYVAAEQDAGALAGAAGDHARIDSAAQNIESSRRVWALQNGVKSDVADFMIHQDTSKVYAGAVISMLDSGNDQGAKAAFDEWKAAGKFSAADQNRLGPKVQSSSTLGEAYRITDVVMSYEPSNLQDGLTHLDKLVEQDKIDPKVREEASRLISQRWQAQKFAAKQAEDQAFESAADSLRKTGDFEALQKSSQWSELPERDKEHLEMMYGRMTRPEVQRNDPQAVANFYSMSKEDMAQMSKADLLRYAPMVKDGEFVDMTKHWNAARQKEDDAAFKFTEHEEEYVFTQAKYAGLAGLSRTDSMDKLNKTKADAYGPIREEVKAALKAYVHNEKKNPNQEQREKIVNDIVVEKALAKPEFGPLTRAADWITGGRIGAFAAGMNVPPAVRTAIISDVKALTGNDPSGQKIMQLWHAKKLGASKDELRKLALQE